MTKADRDLLAADLSDALTIAEPLLGERGKPYADALRAVVEALRQDPDKRFDFTDAIRVVMALEPTARGALLESGLEPAETEAVLALARIGLRRLEAALTGTEPAPETAPAEQPLQPEVIGR